MEAQLTFEELEKRLHDIAKRFPEVRKLDEWKRMRDAMRRARRARPKALTLDVLDAAEEFDMATLYYLASITASGGVRATFRC